MKLFAYALCVLLLASCPAVDNQIEEAIKKIEKPFKKDTPKVKKEVTPDKGKAVKPLKNTPGKLEAKKEVTPPGSDGSGTPGTPEAKKEVTPPGSDGSGTPRTPEAKKEVTPPGGVGEIAEKLKKVIAGIDTPGPKPVKKSGEGSPADSTPEESTPDEDAMPGPTEEELKTATEQLFNAVEANDVESLKQAIAGGADTEAKDSEGFTALQLAIYQEKTEVIKALIARGANPDTLGKYGLTALLLAARRGNEDAVIELLKADPKPNLEVIDRRNGIKALRAFVIKNKPRAVEALINAGARFNDLPGGRFVDLQGVSPSRPIDIAKARGFVEIVRILETAIDAEEGTGDTGGTGDTEETGGTGGTGEAEASTPEEELETATEQLFNAVEANDVESLKQAIAGGADTEAKDSEGYTPLHLAVEQEKTEVIKALIAGGANPDTPWKYGHTALTLAAHLKKTESLKALIEAGGVTAGSAGAALRVAANRGPLEALEALLGDAVVLGVIDSKDSKGNTALMVAINKQIRRKQSQTEIIEFSRALITAGADVNIRNYAGRNALLMAARWGYEDVVIELLKADPKPELEVIDKRRGTKALWQFVIKNNPRAVQALVNAGARFNDPKRYYNYNIRPIDIAKQNKFNEIITILQTALDANSEKLFTAVDDNDVAALDEVLAKGVDVNGKDSEGYTALMKAALAGHPDIVRALIKAGADVEAKTTASGATALMIAAEEGQTEAVQALLESPGIKKDAQDTDGWTALMLAASEGHTNTVKALLDKGADANAVDNDQKTALMYASEGGYLAIVQALIAAGALIDIEDAEGETALSQATENGHKAIIDLLTPVDSKGPGGITALMWKSGLGDTAAIDNLLKRGADVNLKDDNGFTALMGAVYYDKLEAVKILIKKGRADVNLKANNGFVALHLAAQNGNLEIVKALLAGGANKDIATPDGDTASTLANKKGHTAVVALLEE